MRRTYLLPYLLPIALVACASEADLDVPDGCQPISFGVDCALPYPSDFFRRPSDSGFDIRLTGEAKLRSDERASAELAESIPIQGFSRWPLIVATFSTKASDERLVKLFDPPAQSVDRANSATFIIDAASGEPVIHFADLDALEGEGRNALVLHPRGPLAADTRYVVAVAGLTGEDGAPVAPPDGFRELRDGRAIDGYERFDDDVFAVVERFGLTRDQLQLAWDFTTGNDDVITRDMRVGREKTMAAVAAKPVAVVVEEVEENPPDAGKALIWREIRGEITVPLFMDDAQSGASLVRGADGDVQIVGEVQVPFIAMVPKSLEQTTVPGIALGYGHGFFGDRREVLKEPPQRIATAVGAVLFGIDWQGMSMRDATALVENLVSHPSNALHFTDRVHQGVWNWIAFTSAIRNGMADLPAFRRPDGTAVFDPSRVAMIGISQGHILGGVAAAVVPDFDRVALNVGGAGMTHMMYRSKPFAPFLELLGLAMSDPLRRLTFVSTMQRRLDRIDPATYGPYVVDTPFPGSTERQVLVQLGIADTSVPDFTGYLHARTLGASLLVPSPIEVQGLEAFAPGDRAAVTVYDFGVDQSFMANHEPPPVTNPVHNGVRQLPAALEQLRRFLAPGGSIVHPCDGPCDPE